MTLDFTGEPRTAALSLFAGLTTSWQQLDGDWRIAYAQAGHGVESGFADPAFDDALWETVRLPHLRHATIEHDTLWYRHRFQAKPAPPDRRIILRLGGAFYHSRVWLNGSLLGQHEGYFQPFGFDITDRLQPGENLLAVCCVFPVEATSFKRKTAIAGVFADWDCKPYPSALYPELPAPYEWTVPLGLWQPVGLHTSGPVLVESLNTFWTEVWQGGARLDQNRLDFRVGMERRQQRPPRRVPGWLVNKVYQRGSLHHTDNGFSFGLRNPAMPASIQRLGEVRVDGVALELTQVELVWGGVTRLASTITPEAPLEIPSHQRLTVVVRQAPLPPGPHRLEITVDLLGFGEIAVQIRDNLI